MTIEKFIYDTEPAGPHLLISGAIHGNEKCGTTAILWLKDLIDEGRIRFKKGKITLIPICNQQAFDDNVRFTESNLNRHFYKKDNAKTYEDTLCNELVDEFQTADILLDIHSYHSTGASFVFVDPDHKQARQFAGMLGIDTCMYGFSNGYETNQESMGTREYVHAHDGYGVTLECGQHENHRSIIAAMQAIIGALYHLGFVDLDDDLMGILPERRSDDDLQWFQLQQSFIKEKEGQLVGLEQFEPVKKDQVLAKYTDGDTITSPYDAVMVFPHDTAAIGIEWFYIAKITR